MSGQRQYSGFSVFYNGKKLKPSAPDYNGKGTIGQETLDYILDCQRAGVNPELEIVGWMKEGRDSGVKFQSLEINIPWKVRKERQERAGSGQAPPQRQAAPSRPSPRQQAQGGFPGLDDEIPF